MTLPKPRWQSKTYLVNLVLVALMGVELQLHALQPLLPIDVYTLFAFALPVINLVLRELTTGPVGSLPAPPPPEIDGE